MDRIDLHQTIQCSTTDYDIIVDLGRLDILEKPSQAKPNCGAQ
ncbi:hypothetical protein VIBNISO65_1000013 [Vibrio nigripulchritudo SO65]|nr:hypothetical protein VIBNIAM115_1690009 [Vibrio nigripulchritudo AM115]CCN41680.1 hypothetical protein VIBNIFTn2_180001 [Vibrio nigripulchritudo FTn2]CCN65059.1 hypothetical protein VIBNIPon4_330001 [Vibrio nigripulchritudo POn4]CCN74005.1 hypothetical protein VIBNISO65_1000013 [Vibrio nigripulchritudo SO65]